ncbi:hypothetical protein C2845_PM13G21000 [Panicum miliaceum]|uniref:Uncharacterized protein n=1 Tax=Panicum miliaceum TaxID=4540 RepID=A0A3L6RMX9_PANMI|nr:hypothetical protein C2845_PM13G21000 [Panicum miliaceum]
MKKKYFAGSCYESEHESAADPLDGTSSAVRRRKSSKVRLKGIQSRGSGQGRRTVSRPVTCLRHCRQQHHAPRPRVAPPRRRPRGAR